MTTIKNVDSPENAMNPTGIEDAPAYKAGVNHEEQYFLWPMGRANPSGWNATGKDGRLEERLAYIKEVWTDLRPLGLRKKMAAEKLGASAQ